MHQLNNDSPNSCCDLWGAAVHSLKQHISVATLAAVSSLI